MFLLLIINLAVSLCKNNIVTINIDAFYTDGLCSVFHFPKENIKRRYYLNTYTSFSLFSFSNFIDANIKGKKVFHFNGNIYANLYNTDIETNSGVVVHNFSFYAASGSTSWARDIGISLGYHYDDESFSLIHQLYKSGKIKHLKYSFNNPIEALNGTLSFGGVEGDKHLELPYKGVIKINEELPTWGFNLTKIKYKNETFSFNIPCIISSGMYNMLVSNDVFDSMIKNIFYEYINNRTCEIRKTSGTHDRMFLLCQKEYIFDGEIELTFEYVTVKVKIKDLFDGSNGSHFHSNSHQPIHNFNGMILGIEFLRLFNFTVFDYENKQVEFYSDLNPIYETYSYNKLLYTIYVFVMLICLSNAILLIKLKL